MIPVQPAEEPETFDELVRGPGRNAIAEMVGEEATVRPGPRRKSMFASRDEIPWNEFPDFWRRALPDLLERYHRLCAYLALYIPRGTGAPSVDHMVAKSVDWDRVYEWDNYRLACSLMNTHKGIATVLDPFEVEDGWFALELVEFRVVPGLSAEGPLRDRVVATIRQLQLNTSECCEARRAYADEYEAGDISLDYLQRRAPFVAAELQRQNPIAFGT